jgi:hypothetical protein
MMGFFVKIDDLKSIFILKGEYKKYEIIHEAKDSCVINDI